MKQPTTSNTSNPAAKVADAFQPVDLRRSLNGTWKIVADRGDAGLKAQWWAPATFPAREAKAIEVPGNTWEALPDYNGVAWYLRTFDLTVPPAAGRRSFLRFGAVQYLCRAWLNGSELGAHEGGEGPFEFEVTGKLAAGTNTVILRVENPPGVFRNGKVPVAYDNGGVNGHVELIEQPRLRIADVYAKPDPATGAIAVEVTCDNAGEPATLDLRATVFERKSRRERHAVAFRVTAPAGSSVHHLALRVEAPHKWDLDDPFLYTVVVRAAANGDEDIHRIERLGFRDFRIVDGFFHLNGRRIFLKCCHHNRYDPVRGQGVARDMTWLGVDAERLKAAGFNAFRAIVSAFLPEQLAIADEVGLLMYSEHAGSWLLRDKSKYRIELLDLLRRDRHSPSLVIWGLLNEIDGRSPGVYPVARDTLPLIRAVDDTRMVFLSSGRWDRDLVNGSASNPGSTTWDVFLGGEGPHPKPTGMLPEMNPGGGVPAGGFIDGAGDIHVYNTYPTSWTFLNVFRTFAAATRPVFVSEGGNGSVFDCFTEQRKLAEAKAPASAQAWKWATPRVQRLESLWQRYGLAEAYPEIPAMIADSQRNAACERDLFTRAIRANPQFCGYSLTSMTDAWGAGEGIWDNFRDWKAGHREVITAGWAHTRFCLFVNPTPIASGKPFRVVVALADEDRLPAGARQVTLRVRDSAGVEHWTKTVPLTLGAPGKRPLATVVFDEDLPALPLAEGRAAIQAVLDNAGALPGGEIQAPVYEAARHPKITGDVQVIGLGAPARALLSSRGANVRDHDPNRVADRMVIVCGSELPAGWKAQSWRGVYAQVARGAHLLVMGHQALDGGKGPTHFLAIAQKGKLVGGLDAALYHRETIARPGTAFAGLPAGLLTSETYGRLLYSLRAIGGAAPADATLAVSFNDSGMGGFDDGVVIGTWGHGAGRITVCMLDVIPQLGSPVADRLFLNLVRHAQAGAVELKPIPPGHEAQLDALGIKD